MEYEVYQISQPHYVEAAKSFIAQVELMLSGNPSNTQAQDALNIAESYATIGPKIYKFIAITKAEQNIAGLMTLKMEDSAIKVEDVCAKPGMAGVGTKLIERAVQFSEKMGKNGKLTLTDMSKPKEEGGPSFYEKLGFKKQAGELLKKDLDPNTTPAIWKKKPGGKLWKKQ
ncbi:GNAT family N-acetyltransferase [Jeongeupia wiesaeckerbachi]|uniref:hypothetical protein n=1 Tax=Jeongeupia wiesaeckerbachi TaxID=3051218 RepID=UPI003D8015F0